MILMKHVIREGHKTLEMVAKDVKIPLSTTDKKTLKNMLQFVINSQDETIATQYELRGAVGIAAPQINISKRMFAVHVIDFDGTLYSYALINPKLVNKSNSIFYLPGGEGCLSVDRDTEGITPRYETIELEAFNYDIQTDEVKEVHLKLSGYVGIVFQHELDHLNGIMFTTKLFETLPFAKPAFEIESETT